MKEKGKFYKSKEDGIIVLCTEDSHLDFKGTCVASGDSKLGYVSDFWDGEIFEEVDMSIMEAKGDTGLHGPALQKEIDFKLDDFLDDIIKSSKAASEEEQNEWAELESVDTPIMKNDVRQLFLPVKVMFRWSDKIIEHEDEDGVEYREGWVMDVLPQTIVYNGEDTTYLYNVQEISGSGQ